MMDADIACEPPQQDRKIVMRAAVQCGVLEFPVVAFGPVRFLELMLNIKKPDTGRRRDQRDWRLHQEKGTYSHQPHQAYDRKDDAKVGGDR